LGFALDLTSGAGHVELRGSGGWFVGIDDVWVQESRA